eukprot:SAG31_NODE_4106_length_3577_cov_3.156699_4_plen_424_part_00
MTLAQCEQATMLEPRCGDHFYSNIHTTPTASAKQQMHYACGCAHLHSKCILAASDIGNEVFKCARGYRTDCTTGYLPRKTGSTPRGTPCMFPFKWRGVEYTECTRDDGFASCVDLEHWVAVEPFSVRGLDCAAYAAMHCAGGDGLVNHGIGGGELDPWIATVGGAVDKWNRTAASACCGCGGGTFSGDPLPWCLTDASGQWGDCDCLAVDLPPPTAHCSPVVFDPVTMGFVDRWDRLLNRYDLSDCQQTIVAGKIVEMVPAGSQCMVHCAANPWPFDGTPAVFICPANNTDPYAPPRGELPDCAIGIPERNPFLSPPQGISPDCAASFNAMLDCVRPARRAACAGEGSQSCKASKGSCNSKCQEKVDRMYYDCSEVDGWESWKVGIKVEVEAGGCSAAMIGQPFQVSQLAGAVTLWLLWFGDG